MYIFTNGWFKEIYQVNNWCYIYEHGNWVTKLWRHLHDVTTHYFTYLPSTWPAQWHPISFPLAPPSVLRAHPPRPSFLWGRDKQVLRPRLPCCFLAQGNKPDMQAESHLRDIASEKTEAWCNQVTELVSYRNTLKYISEVLTLSVPCQFGGFQGGIPNSIISIIITHCGI